MMLPADGRGSCQRTGAHHVLPARCRIGAGRGEVAKDLMLAAAEVTMMSAIYSLT